MKTREILSRVLMLAALLSVLVVGLTNAQEPETQGETGIEAALNTAFTYQGRLLDGGTPADGTYDFEFRLYRVASDGNPVGGPVSVGDQPVAEGLFTVQLDFGDVFDGTALWLEVLVRPGDSNAAYTRLTPRQPLTAAPYAHSLRPGASIVGKRGGEGVLYAENASPNAYSIGLYGRASATTGWTYGVLGQSNSTEGKGVFGYAYATTGGTHGVWGQSRSNLGTGVYGYADASTGATHGVVGESASTSGTGVLGRATATDGYTYGVFGESASPDGEGVHGLATATSGINAGLYGRSLSTEGRGVYGWAYALSGPAYGVMGESRSSAGAGVYGRAGAASGLTSGVHGESDSPDGKGVSGVGTNGGYGVFGLTMATVSDNTPAVFGQSQSPEGRGVYGYATSDIGRTFGVYGRSNSTEGIGVRGYAQASSGPAYGVYGKSDSTAGTGVYGSAAATSGLAYGVVGKSASTDGIGVYGDASSMGVYGVSSSTYGVSVMAHASATSGSTYGVYAQSDSTAGMGVYGVAAATSGTNFGLYGRSDSTAGTGLYGVALATSGNAYGVEGKSWSTAGRGVYGWAGATTGINYGVYGQSDSTDGVGVAGFQTGYDISDLGGSWKPGGLFGGRNGVVGITREVGGVGVFGLSTPGGYAGQFDGDVYVYGTLTATSKSFKIDHPLDPANQYLYHYSVESAERLNQYTGNVTLDANGEAWVELPAWFQAVNTDVRYQLTCIGGFSPVYVAQEVQDNRFQIAGGEPGMKVSWMVTALRNDPYAQQHPSFAEQEKPEGERGTYLDPGLYGQPEEMGIHYQQSHGLTQP